MKFPRIQGADVAGRIVAVGEGVPQSRIGERVLVDNALYGGGEEGLPTSSLISSERDGGYAEYTAVPAENAHPVESDLTDAELATFPTAYTTALRRLNRLRLSEGETVLVTGASGGVGSGLVQLAKLRGAYVVAQVGGNKESEVLRIGADAVVLRDTPDLTGALEDATGREQVDTGADVVGGPAFPAMLEVLRPMGRYVSAGGIAGPMVELDLRTLYLKQLELIGSTMGTHEEFSEQVGLIESGQ
jgi:NADPH:quinone reductase-like Zn-dependent oxidoreductase